MESISSGGFWAFILILYIEHHSLSAFKYVISLSPQHFCDKYFTHFKNDILKVRK